MNWRKLYIVVPQSPKSISFTQAVSVCRLCSSNDVHFGKKLKLYQFTLDSDSIEEEGTEGVGIKIKCDIG
jgi:hypothetical protein